MADEPSIVHELPVQAIAQLERDEPALAAIRAQASAFAWIHTLPPHDPFLPPASDRSGQDRALLRRAGLPAFLHPVLNAAIRAAAGLPATERRGDFSLAVIRAAQSACIAIPGEEGVRLMALLRRYEAEAARQQSRGLAESLRREVSEERAQFSLLPPDIGPEMLRLSGIDDEPVVVAEAEAEPVVEITPEPAAEKPNRRIEAILHRAGPERPRGLVLDEPIPSLKSLIADWKAEREALDREQAEKIAATFGNANEKPGRSRVA